VADERIERTVLLASIVLAAASVCWGIRIHCRRRILILFGTALFLIVAGKRFAEEPVEIEFTVPGVALFVCGHLLNQRSAVDVADVSAIRTKSVICPSRILRVPLELVSVGVR
jgi:hypothetical protein